MWETNSALEPVRTRTVCSVSIPESSIHFEHSRQLSCEALTVAADIYVTDNCFCNVFFAGLYLSSSVNKTALIFHEDNEVFINKEIGCNSTGSTISFFFLVYQSECINDMPADLEVSSKHEISNKREVRSRRNTLEEKRKQNKEWRKRKREQNFN